MLPQYHSKKATDLASAAAPDPAGPAFGKRKAVIYATCFADYNQPATAAAALAVLARQGVEAEDGLSGLLRHAAAGGRRPRRGGRAAPSRVAAELAPYIADGWDVVTLTASCGLMMKFEWPLILPESEAVRALSSATRDICEYVVELSKAHGLAPGLTAVEGGVTLHHACHARAQNMGAKSAEMLRLIPGTKVDLVERCSGHGGTFGVMKETHAVAVKVGKPAARQVAAEGQRNALLGLPAGLQAPGRAGRSPSRRRGARPAQAHPIEMLARAYGLA